MYNAREMCIRDRNRDENSPIIIAGGPCGYNPEPLADFIDVFLIGDGEELLPKIIEKYIDIKDKNLNREDYYKEISKIDGVYIPGFYEVIYKEDGTIDVYKRQLWR